MATRRDRDRVSPGRPEDSAPQARRAFSEPRLEYVTPKLVRHGRVDQVTAGFFGPFYPGQTPD